MKSFGLQYGFYLTIMIMIIFSGMTESCRHDPFLPDLVTPIDTTGMDTMMIDTMNIDTMNMDTTIVPCDSNLVYFSTEVLPILNSNCAISGCHDEQSAADGVILTSFEHLLSTTEVTPFDLEKTEIFELITESDEDKRMPPAQYSRLEAEQIQLISKWILQGAKNLQCDDEVNCDTTSVSLINQVRPILENHCIGCHSTAGPSGGVILDTYSGIQSVAISGRLVGAVRHDVDFKPMPQNQDKLPQCDIDLITAWVNQGAQNN